MTIKDLDEELILTFSISYKMAKIHPYFTTFFSRSPAMAFKKYLIWSNFNSFSVKNKKSR